MSKDKTRCDLCIKNIPHFHFYSIIKGISIKGSPILEYCKVACLSLDDIKADIEKIEGFRRWLA